jgi:nitrite reductase/ring-hydroxylating ferredoxin subunit
MSVTKTLCRLGDVPDGGASAVEFERDGVTASVIVLRRGERAFAYWNECPHAGRRLDWSPGRFLIEHGQLICAAHGACFAIDSGRCIDGPARGDALAAIAVAVIDGAIVAI